MKNLNAFWRWALGAAGLAVLLTGTTACQKGLKQESESDVQIRIPLVQLYEITSCDSLEKRVFTGFAKEGKTIKQSFRVAGPLVEFPAEIGRRVKQGDVLAKLDTRDFELAVSRVKAGLVEANAALRAMKTGARAEDIASLEAQVAASTSQFETAEKNEQRYAELLKNGSASQAQYDQIKMARDSAKAAKDASEKQLEKGRAGARSEEIEAMEAKIAGLNVTLQQAENALGDTVLVAPSDGYVSQKYVENGEIVAPGVPVLAFTDVSQLQVQTSIPETLLVRQADFVGYTCTFEIYPDKQFDAQLKELGQALQAGKQGYPLEVSILDTQNLNVHPGMSAVVTILLKRATPPLLVPLAALVGDYGTPGEQKPGEPDNRYTGSQKTVVWTIRADDTLEKKQVHVLRVTNEGVEIQSDELQSGDQIVGAGARFLHEGQKVRVK